MWDVIVVGGGAAGFFAAIRSKSEAPRRSVLILERGSKVLRKVSISGGGRCNVTHDCHDIDRLLACYPRGGPRLETLLGQFMPEDTVRWFASRGVPLKTERDGRMFPRTNSSQTIVDCLTGEARKLGVEWRTGVSVRSLTGTKGAFELAVGEEVLTAKRVLLATGGGSKATGWLRAYGHPLEEDIPSLFTFCCSDPVIADLAGLSVERVEARLSLGSGFDSEGPLLITHWGFSGPAILKLSAFAARELYRSGYKGRLVLDLLPELQADHVQVVIAGETSGKQVSSSSPFPAIPKRLWQRLTAKADIGFKQPWSKLKPVSRQRLAKLLKEWEVAIEGKGQFKEEFVTSGGLPLHELDIYTMESRKAPGLYVAGELLDVDGITGGFNFQNAWASGFVAGGGMGGSF